MDPNISRRRGRVFTFVAAVALIPAATRAAEDSGHQDIPAGHLYFGLSSEFVQPFGRALISRKPLGTGRGGGFSLHYEVEHFLIAAEISGGKFAHEDTYSNPFMIAVRAGPVFGSGAYAPYLAVGPALLAYGAVGDDAAVAKGITGEAGVLLFRQMRWFRATAFLQYNLPLSSDTGKGVENVKSLSWAALGLRLQI